MTSTTIPNPRTASSVSADIKNPVFQAYALLRIGFTIAPILFGVDKFAHVLVNWDIYLAPRINDIVPGTAHQAMYAVGVIEIVAGLIVALRPKIGGLIVAACEWALGKRADRRSIGARRRVVAEIARGRRGRIELAARKNDYIEW